MGGFLKFDDAASNDFFILSGAPFVYKMANSELTARSDAESLLRSERCSSALARSQ